MDKYRELIERLVGLAMRDHYYCEDAWYTCVKHPEGSANENKGPDCDCGAADHNKLVEQVAAALRAQLAKLEGR